jgi:pimeloyl-ACP methyl ester carboxylesterase
MESLVTTTWFERLWPRLTAATGIGYLATSYAVARWLTRPSPALVEPPTNLNNVTIENLQCRTSDGILLKGWCIQPEQARGTIALFHGMRWNRSDLLERIAFLATGGYRCIAFDHRAHGESCGRFTSFGYHERHDVEAVARLIRHRWPDDRCAALGISMGAAAVCFADCLTDTFHAFVLESLYHDLARAFQHRVGCGYPSWFGQFRRGILWCTQRRLRLRVDDVAPIDHISKLGRRPVLLLTGSDDCHAPPHEMHALARQLPETCQVHTIAGADHFNVYEAGGSWYCGLLLAFLDQHLFTGRQSRAA